MKKSEAIEEIKGFLDGWKDLLLKCSVTEKMYTSRVKKCGRAEYHKVIDFHTSLNSLNTLLQILKIKENYYTPAQWSHLEAIGFDGVEIESRNKIRKEISKYWKSMPSLENNKKKEANDTKA